MHVVLVFEGCKPVLFDLSLDAIKFSYFKCQMSKTDSSNSLNQILIFVLLYRYDLPFFSSPAYCLTISISCSKLWKQLDRITNIDRFYGTNIFILLQNLKLTNILKPHKKSLKPANWRPEEFLLMACMTKR